MEDHLLRGGQGALELMKMKELAEEEGLSDSERVEQMENNKYYTFLRNQREQKHMKDMDEKEQKMEEEMGDVLVDYYKKPNQQTQGSKTTKSSSKQS